MFVRGTLAEKERVLVDIGTGYYVDKVDWYFILFVEG